MINDSEGDAVQETGVVQEKGKLEGMGRVFAVMAFIEALTWTGLLIGMALKYSGVTVMGVKIFGPLHGWAFIAYVVVTVLAAVRLRWPVPMALLALLAAVPPLVTWPLEVWFRRRGLLSADRARK